MDWQRVTVISLILAVGIVAGVMIRPFLGFVVGGILLGFVLYPVHRRLEQRVPASVAALLVLLITVLAVILPLLFVTGLVAGDAQRFVTAVTQSPDTLQLLNDEVTDALGYDLQLQERIVTAAEQIGSWMQENAAQLLEGAFHIGIGIPLMLFIEFFVLRDGPQFIHWLNRFTNLPDTFQEQLYDRAADTAWAVIKGHMGVAVIQALLIGVAFWLAAIPNTILLTSIMVVLGLIPLVGTVFIWLPAAVYLFLTGSTIAGVALIIYSFLIMNLSDDVLRPFLVNPEKELHDVFILIGIVGGITVFGPIGLFIGPITFGVLKELVLLYQQYYQQ